jgi:hypothetical protein
MQKHTLLLKDINTFPLRCTAYLDPGIQTIKKTNYTIVAKRKGKKESISQTEIEIRCKVKSYQSTCG